MSSAASFPILTSLVLVPAIGAVLVMLVSKRRPELVKLIALLASAGTAALTVWLLWAFEADAEGFQFVSKHTWIDAWGISWHLGVDGISLFLVVLTGVLFPLSIVATDPHHDDKAYLAWMLLLEAGVMGSFISLDLFVFFVFFEIVLVPMYFLIGGWGYEQRVYAATKFFLFTMFGSAFMFVGIIATVFLAATTGSATSRSISSSSPRDPTSRPPRGDGCSSPSRSRSRSRCRSSRSTRGCRTPTRRHRPPARWCSPACC